MPFFLLDEEERKRSTCSFCSLLLFPSFTPLTLDPHSHSIDIVIVTPASSLHPVQKPTMLSFTSSGLPTTASSAFSFSTITGELVYSPTEVPQVRCPPFSPSSDSRLTFSFRPLPLSAQPLRLLHHRDAEAYHHHR